MPRILAVDDEPLVRKAILRVMNRLGHAADEAGDGQSALRLAKDQAYDVALVDFEMPGGPDGLNVLRRLRELQPGCVRVLMTGRSDFPVVVDAVNEGEVLKVLPKPFQSHDLEDLTLEVLAAQRRMAAVVENQREAVNAERIFQEAVDGELIRLAVQPIVRADTHELFAVECLLRSRHPIANGPLPLLRAAERANRVNDLGEAVNQLAARWAEILPPQVPIFVNVHPAQFSDASFFQRFAPLYPHARRVVFEITERASLHDIPHWATAIQALDGAGFNFAVDDLGSGYSGLSLLAELKPAYIKVDMSIVRNVHLEPRKQRLVDLLVNFANATGAKLVAEGVETAEETAALQMTGAHLLQGYYFGKPTLEWPPAH
ncbi:MAG: EAL domain-containing protein [Myxococcota bacterium]